ncbi:hypothetical protein [Vampirovibrio sp.]|uniref:hypothetical protein n=1 Tax=Vampirovibrio sp. TaxID=2717857 RepID=UPI0035949005
MRKKTTDPVAAVGSRKNKSGKPTRKAVNAMEKRLALMGYVRGQDWSTELIEEFQKTELELASCSAQIQSSSTSMDEEAAVMERLRSLEIKRFQLLGQVFGNRVNDYHLLTS